MSRWTNWLSRHPFTVKITGSSPVRSTNSPLAQLGERLSYMQDVVGSIPTGTTNGDVAQLVEHLAEDQGVVSSILTVTTIRLRSSVG